MNESSLSESLQLLRPPPSRRRPSPPPGEPTESKSEYRSRWFSLSVAYSIAFLLGLQESIYWVSLWPFLSTIDATVTEDFFGYIIMAFNLGGAISGPLFGLAVNKYHQTKLPMVIGIVMTIAGNLLVGFVEAFTFNRRWILLIGRFITGTGMGTEGAIFAYIAMGSKPSERNKAVSIRAALMSSSILLGPALQTVFVPIGYPALTYGPLHLNMYTTPAFVNVVVGAVQAVVVLTLFREFWVSVSEASMLDMEDKSNLMPYDKIALAVSMWVRFAQMFCLVYCTSVNSPFTMAMFGWSADEAVLYNGIIMVVTGSIDCAGNLFVGNVVLRYVQERVLILIGISIFILYFLISFSWPWLPPLIDSTSGLSTPTAGLNGITAMEGPSSAPALLTLAQNQTTSCDYIWCSYTTRIYLWQYLTGFVFFILSVSIAFTPNATLFSKMVGPRKQGVFQGLFYASGMVANTVSPPLVSNIFQHFGPRVVWIVGLVALVSVIAIVALFYKRLTPWRAQGSVDERPLLEDSLGLTSSSNYGSTRSAGAIVSSV